MSILSTSVIMCVLLSFPWNNVGGIRSLIVSVPDRFTFQFVILFLSLVMLWVKICDFIVLIPDRVTFQLC